MSFLRAAATVSVLALSASTLQAQTGGANRSVVNDSGTGNEAIVSNDSPGNELNDSVITFVGQDHRVSVTQIGDYNRAGSRHEGTANRSALRQTGDRNSASITQLGERNNALVDQHLDAPGSTASDRTITLEQRGADNSASVRQAGSGSTATVVQGVADALAQSSLVELTQTSPESYATIHVTGGQAGTPNQVRLEQAQLGGSGTRNYAQLATRGSGNRSETYQAGREVSTIADQSGSNNLFTVRSVGDFSSTSVSQGGTNNVINSVQEGAQQTSRITQMTFSPQFEVSDNLASIQQRGLANSSEVQQQGIRNSATVVQGSDTLPSQASSSRIDQRGSGNVGRNYLFEGGLSGNFSAIIQSATPDILHAGNLGDVSIRGHGNGSGITQYGRLHQAIVSILGGRASLGNSSQILQENAGHVARVSIGSRAPDAGYGNRSSIIQRGEHSTIGHIAEVWQRGRSDAVSIRQVIRGAQDDGGAFASISQRGDMGGIDLRQVGHHVAMLTQGLGQQSQMIVSQWDSGGESWNEFGFESRISNEPFRGNNKVQIAQYGDFNIMVARAEGSDNFGELWQKVGSAYNQVSLNQGAKSTSVNGAPACSAGCQFARTSSATMIQEGRYNRAEISQYGRATARVEQAGSGGVAFNNMVTVTQTGEGASATVFQHGSVGPSSAGDPASGRSAEQNRSASGDLNAQADPFYWMGGARATVASIFQTGPGSVASIEQQGRGQFALIEQRGDNNLASIFQALGATNATAAIVQTGNGNSYEIRQDQPGQYLHATQTGTGNSVTNVIARGPGS